MIPVAEIERANGTIEAGVVGDPRQQRTVPGPLTVKRVIRCLCGQGQLLAVSDDAALDVEVREGGLIPAGGRPLLRQTTKRGGQHRLAGCGQPSTLTGPSTEASGLQRGPERTSVAAGPPRSSCGEPKPARRAPGVSRRVCSEAAQARAGRKRLP